MASAPEGTMIPYKKNTVPSKGKDKVSLSRRSTTSSEEVTSSAVSDKWWKDVVCYQIWPLSFNDTNNDGKGDIGGIITKLNYLQDLGIDVIWVSPTYKSSMKDYGYDISDWQDIAPTFGTMELMEKLIREVHARKTRILLDLVVTHTSTNHRWFAESRMSRTNPKADWYIWKDGRPGHKIYNHITNTNDLVEEPTNWKGCFSDSTWEWIAEREQYYLHLFMVQEPDLNWELPEVRQAIYEEAVGFWLKKGIDGFRIDTANRLSKDPKFPDADIRIAGKRQPAFEQVINGPKRHIFLQELRAYMDNHPSVKDSGRELMLVGELPLTPYQDLINFVHPDSKELSMVFDFDVIKLGGHDNPDEVKGHQVKNLSHGHPLFTLELFKKNLAKVQKLIADGAWGTVFMECHDQCRSVTRYATPYPQYYKKAAKLLCLLQTTLSGTQFVYQGQEIGMTNVPSDWDYDDFRDPGAKNCMEEERAKNGEQGWIDARFGNQNFGRDNCRTPVQWSNQDPYAGFSLSEHGTWIKVNPNYKDGVNVDEQRKDKQSIWSFWQNHIAKRKEHKHVYMHGSFEILDLDNPNAFTYIKTAKDGTRALVCLNFSSEARPVNIPAGSKTQFFTGNDKLTLESADQDLEPWEGRVYWLYEYTPNPQLQSAKVGVKSGGRSAIASKPIPSSKKTVSSSNKTVASSSQANVKSSSSGQQPIVSTTKSSNSGVESKPSGTKPTKLIKP